MSHPQKSPQATATQGAQVSEAQAREVAEQARETVWALPSFGKQLFLGSFQLDLIHPHPRLHPPNPEPAALAVLVRHG